MNFNLDPMLPNLEERYNAAIQSFWQMRRNEPIVDDEDESEAEDITVRSGKHLDSLRDLVRDIVVHAGLLDSHIKTAERLQLPGYFRPEKQWDLLVIADDSLVAAIECKSQLATKISKNYNNRVEEAIGTANDLWTAYRGGRLGIFRPLLGYLFVLEDTEKTRRSLTPLKEPYFEADQIFKVPSSDDGTMELLALDVKPPKKTLRSVSYAMRYEVLLERLVLEKLYDTTCLTLATNETPSKIHTSSVHSFRKFAADLAGQVIKFLGNRQGAK